LKSTLNANLLDATLLHHPQTFTRSNSAQSCALVKTSPIMATSKGLRGRKLSLAVWGVAMWAIIISGFNQASAGGVLGNPLFLKQFPQLNTAGPDSQHKSTIQGE
jgi:hypothetical protein